MSKLIERIRKQGASAFTHSGKFHADDVFSAALLLYLNPEIQITRGNRVPEEYEEIVFDIGRGKYDHHQKDSRVRENGTPYAAFGLLWEELGEEILGKELAEKFDESFVQPLDLNDNTGEKNELATLIGNFNPTWDAKGGSDEAFFQAVSVAGMILEHKFERFQGNERADQRVEELLADCKEGTKILVLPEFVPCQKRLSETEIAFVIFPSNRGGYCIQPQKKEYSLNYKCSFPVEWLGMEGEELVKATGLQSAGFCHKGGFLMTTDTLEDAVKACEISLAEFQETPVIVCYGATREDEAESRKSEENGVYVNRKDSEIEQLLHQLPKLQAAKIVFLDFPELPELEVRGIYGEVAMEKLEWKARIKQEVKRILKYKPEAVYVADCLFFAYPIVHSLRKKHVPVLTLVETNGEKRLVRIPSGS